MNQACTSEKVEYRITNFPSEVNDPAKEAAYLMKDGHMKGRYLGQCLDSCRWGSIMTILYEMNNFQMVEFVKEWMKQNKDDLRFHYRPLPVDFDVPRIDYKVCPRDSEHKGKNLDLEGRIRCAAEDKKELREALIESYTHYDDFSQSKRKEYLEFHLDDWELEKYENAPRITVKERCGAILSDKGSVLPLAEVIDRLDIFQGSSVFCKGETCKDPFLKEFDLDRKCFGHVINNHLEFPFDGWYLAWNVQKWYEQKPDGTTPFTTPELTKRIMKKIKPI